jgi:hypothetical protein
MAVVESVKDVLRKQKVKLWLPPYTPDDGGALASLASSIALEIAIPAETVGAALEELRQHALAKLAEKTRITLMGRIIGAGCCSNAPAGGGELKEQCDIEELGAVLLARLCERFGAQHLRVIAGGRALEEGATLKEQGWKCDSERGQKPLKVLFIASGKKGAPFTPPSRVANSQGDAVSAEAASIAGVEDSRKLFGIANEATGQESPASVSITSVAHVREAAEALTSEGFGDFDLYDSKTGKLQPVPSAARQALITAIALHARGRELLSASGQASVSSSAPAEGDGIAPLDTTMAEALEFLVEADRCFERCRETGAAQILDQLENFGQLQLDICWAYALLGDTDCLPDAVSRLETAEKMIQRQVDRNFLTLAQVQAEQGKTLPPEVLPSVRLWLLRGVARRCRGDPEASADLQRAAIFMQGLRVHEDDISNLLTLGASRLQAIAALRRSGGNADAAAEALLAGATQKGQQRVDREAARKFGKTADGSFVEPQCVAQLLSMGVEEKLAVAALKKAKNDVPSALDILQSEPADVLLGNKKPRVEPNQQMPVDDLALATVVSMGFDAAVAEKALRASGGNVEDALMALTMDNTQTSAAPATTDGTEYSELPAASVEEEPAAESPGVTSGEAPELPAAATEGGNMTAAEQKKQVLDHAREVVEQALGQCLRKSDLDDEVAGAELEMEEALLQQHLSSLC